MISATVGQIQRMGEGVKHVFDWTALSVLVGNAIGAIPQIISGITAFCAMLWWIFRLLDSPRVKRWMRHRRRRQYRKRVVVQ